MKSGFWRGALFRLLAVALAVCTISDGRTSRIAYAQGATDPVVMKARAAINRGQYAEAEALLKPLAAKDARRRSGARAGAVLRDDRPARRSAADARTHLEHSGRAPDHRPPSMRGSVEPPARFGEFQLANDAYRIAAERAPQDPAVHTGWGELFFRSITTPRRPSRSRRR